MRLDFNVLWVDDQPDRVESQTKPIAKRMEVEGFQFNPTRCVSMEEVRRLLREDVFRDEIDLILVDWDLGEGVQGQDAIFEIRETVPYRDVIFYSARNPTEELRKLALDRGIEGFYCASREELVDEVLEIFHALVKKVLDLDHTRGIVMGATSDIDQTVRECLIIIHEKLDGASQQAMIEETLSRVDDYVQNVSRQATKLRKSPTMAAFFKAHMILSSKDRLKMLSESLERNMFSVPASATAAVGRYSDQVLPGRNDLGHRVLSPEGKPQAIANDEGKQVSLSEMRELRRLILGFRSDFRNLRDALKG